MGKMTVYNGSYASIIHPQIIKGKILKILDPIFIARLFVNKPSAGQNGMTPRC